MGIKTLEQKSAQDLAGLQVDLLQRLRNGNMSFVQIEWFKNIPFELRNKLMEISKKYEHPKMELISQRIEVPILTREIDFHREFTENKKVKYSTEGLFDKHLLSLAEKVSSLPSMSFDKYEVVADEIYDKDIKEHFKISESADLMTREEALWAILFLTGKQPKGEPGILLVDGTHTIIGYVLSSVRGWGKSAISVSVWWSSYHSDWNCRCDSGGYYRRSELREILSLNRISET